MRRVLFPALVLPALFVAPLQGRAAPPENLLRNGGFEEPATDKGLPGWEQGKHYGEIAKGSRLEQDPGVPREGKASLKVTSAADGVPVIVQSDAVALDPAKTYAFSVYLKAAAADTPVRLFLVADDFKRMQSREDQAGTEWRQYVVILPPKAKGTNAPVRARFDLMGKGTLWVDQAELREFDPATWQPSEYIGWRRGAAPGEANVAFSVGAPGGAFPSINGLCYAYRFGGRELDPRFAELGPKVVRVHNVLSNFHLIRRGEDFRLQYQYDELDAVLAAVLKTGAVPEVNLCFVPLQLVYNPEPDKIRNSYDGFYLGPPSNLKEWEAMIREIVTHCRERYDISKWYWVFGNEPDVAKLFSMGTQEDFFRIYQATVAGAVAAYPDIKIGAGAFAGRMWLKDFVDRCGRAKTRLDVLTWHHYGLVPEDFRARIAETRRWLAAAGCSDKTILGIDEWNPWLPDGGQHKLSASNYAAAQMAASIAVMQQAGLDYHTFFIAHSPMPFGMLSPKGVKHPTFNAMKLFAMMGRQSLTLAGGEHDPYIGALAARRDDGTLTVMVWYAKYHYDLVKDAAKTVTLRLGQFPAAPACELYVIDATRSNGFKDPARQELETTTEFQCRTAADGNTELSFTAQPSSLFLLVAKPATK